MPITPPDEGFAVMYQRKKGDPTNRPVLKAYATIEGKTYELPFWGTDRDGNKLTTRDDQQYWTGRINEVEAKFLGKPRERRPRPRPQEDKDDDLSF
jgi:hypothetical protein